jgi:hypothetical protein
MQTGETTALDESTSLEEATTAFQDLQEEDVLEAAPDTTLSYGRGKVRSSLSGGYCWQTTRTDGGCITDMVLEFRTSLKKELHVPSGSEMVFHYEAPRPPNEVIAYTYPLLRMPTLPNGHPVLGSHSYDLEVHGSGVQGTIPAELPPREYLVFVHVDDPQGGLGYEFRVVVQ